MQSPFATPGQQAGRAYPVASGEFYHYGQSGTGQVQQMDIVTNVPGISGLTYLRALAVRPTSAAVWPNSGPAITTQTTVMAYRMQSPDSGASLTARPNRPATAP